MMAVYVDAQQPIVSPQKERQVPAFCVYPRSWVKSAGGTEKLGNRVVLRSGDLWLIAGKLTIAKNDSLP
jgi:hypothetical protein